MDKPAKFLLPSPSFGKQATDMAKKKPHYLTPSGMSLLPREKQPPPMYGARGATVPARYLKPTAPTVPAVVQPVAQYCEPCEMELQSMEDFKRHRAQHEICPVEGCHYKGHPSVMDKHIMSLHNSGLFNKLQKLSTPEEIEAWRAERRKRYPTVANVLAKQQAKEQRQRRGERLEEQRNRFGKAEDKKRVQDTNPINGNSQQEGNKKSSQKRNKRNRKLKQERQQNNSNAKDVKDEPKEKEDPKEEEESSYLFPKFRGTSEMVDYQHKKLEKKPVQINALVGLLAMYGSDDEANSMEEDEDNVDENKPDKETIKANEEFNENNTQNCDNLKDKFQTNELEKSLENQENSKQSEVNGELAEGREKKLVEREKNDSLDELLDSHVSSIELVKQIENPSTESSICNETKHLGNFDNPDPSTSEAKLVKDTLQCPTSDDEAPEETAIQRSIPDYEIAKHVTANTSAITTSTPTENIGKSANSTPKDKTNGKPLRKRKSGLDYRKLKLRKQNTMLEKLLESDIRHERNVLLQCVRYVCENNFFNVGS